MRGGDPRCWHRNVPDPAGGAVFSNKPASSCPSNGGTERRRAQRGAIIRAFRKPRFRTSALNRGGGGSSCCARARARLAAWDSPTSTLPVLSTQSWMSSEEAARLLADALTTSALRSLLESRGTTVLTIEPTCQPSGLNVCCRHKPRTFRPQSPTGVSNCRNNSSCCFTLGSSWYGHTAVAPPPATNRRRVGGRSELGPRPPSQLGSGERLVAASGSPVWEGTR